MMQYCCNCNGWWRLGALGEVQTRHHVEKFNRTARASVFFFFASVMVLLAAFFSLHKIGQLSRIALNATFQFMTYLSHNEGGMRSRIGTATNDERQRRSCQHRTWVPGPSTARTPSHRNDIACGCYVQFSAPAVLDLVPPVPRSFRLELFFSDSSWSFTLKRFTPKSAISFRSTTRARHPRRSVFCRSRWSGRKRNVPFSVTRG
jgi:hypothetical protein